MVTEYQCNQCEEPLHDPSHQPDSPAEHQYELSDMQRAVSGAVEEAEVLSCNGPTETRAASSTGDNRSDQDGDDQEVQQVRIREANVVEHPQKQTQRAKDVTGRNANPSQG